MSDAVWNEVRRYDRMARGFDGNECWLPHFAVPALSGEREQVFLSRPALEEDVRGSFAAIAELAGFWGTLPCDPENRTLAESALMIAEELRDSAAGLMRVLADRLENDDDDWDQNE